MSHNVNTDGDRTSWCQLRGEERMAREDAERSRLLMERIRGEDELNARRYHASHGGRPATLDADTVQALRRIIADKAASQGELCHAVDVSPAAISQVARRSTHRDVPEGMTDTARERMAELLAAVEARRETNPPRVAPLSAIDVQAARHLHWHYGIGRKWVGRILKMSSTAAASLLSGESYQRVPDSASAEVLARVDEMNSEIRRIKTHRQVEAEGCRYCGKPRKLGRGNPKTCGGEECVRRLWSSYSGKKKGVEP